jgi:streptomycin 6-kinase
VRLSLANTIAELAKRWSLQADSLKPFSTEFGLPNNFVAGATLNDGTPVVLKVTGYHDELSNEIAALQLWNGNGAARLLQFDLDRHAVLLERIQPGVMLADVAAYDDDAVQITADLLRQLWIPRADGLRSLDSWCDAYRRNHTALMAGVEGFPKALFSRADALRRELLESTSKPVALHGDMHHYNVLQSDRAGWLAIDPKGLFGDRHFDVCQFLRNPLRPVSPPDNRRRLDRFSDLLQLDRQRLSHWALVHAVLDACWSFEEGGDFRPKVTYAAAMLGI